MNKKLELISKLTDIKIENISICKYCSDEYPLYDIEKEALDKQGFKYPDLCASCRFRMMYSYINDKHLYRRKDSKTGKDIISILSDSYKGDVIEAKEYKNMMSDDYGLTKGVDLGDNIFDDFKKLYETFPKYSRMVYEPLDNSEYSSHCGWSKNIYLSFCVFEECEDIFYSIRILGYCKNVFNSMDVEMSSDIYESRMVHNSHDISYSRNIAESNKLMYCYNMQSSTNCIFCCNRVNVKYMIYNKQYTKEEYEKIENDIYIKINDFEKHKEIKKEFDIFLKENYIDVSLNIQKSEKAVGDNLYGSSNVINSFKCVGNKNCVNVILSGNKDDDKMENIFSSIEAGQGAQNCIGSCSFGQEIYNLFFCNTVSQGVNLYYSIDMQSCEECMFCVGLRNKKYCILNRQYSKQQYFSIKEKIVLHLKSKNEWGDFLGFDMSVFPYNDSSAYDFFRVNKIIYADGKEEIIDKNAKGIVTVFGDNFISDAELNLGGEEKIKIKWRTRNKEINIPEGMKTIESKNLISISEADKLLLNKAIICRETKRPYRIIESELDFLKRKNLPLPRIHHELRIEKLILERSMGELFVSDCDKCNKEILSIYREKPEYKVYCEECYSKFMYK